QRLPPSPRRRLGFAAIASVVLHAAVLALLLVGFAHRQRMVAAADTPAVVELVMSPPGNSKTSAPATAPPHAMQARPAAKPVPPVPPRPPQPVPAPVPPAAAPPPPPPDGSTVQALVAPEPAAAQPEAAQAAPAPEQPQPAKPAPATAPAPPAPEATPALQLSLGGIASDTNALVTGRMLLPPGADPKFRNRKPNYPQQAALRGEEGTVVLMIHISPEGLVSGVDILQSTGYPDLDRSARDAVMSWHFLPAIQDGQPVPFQMRMRIQFALF
ncbi:MAG TPA: energy transducer TonB, partial [Acetobacteraceae bacterium]|nr:energy transducer TonB [Acetobacteraceae bacterium]